MEQTSFIDKTSKKVFGRRWTPEMHIYAEMADNARLGMVDRRQLEVLPKQLLIIGIKKSAVILLQELITTAPPEQFLGGKQLPIVFKKNTTLGDKLNLKPDTVGRLLSYLFHNGLIVMRDSNNYRRFSPKRENLACGIDLRILVARYDELTQIVKNKQEEIERYDAASTEYSTILKHVKDKRPFMEGHLFGRFLLRRIERIQSILGDVSKATFLKLEQACRLMQGLLKRFKMTKNTYQIIKNTYQYVKTSVHIESNNLKNKGSLEKLDSNNQDFCITTTQNKTIIKSPRKVDDNETELETLLEPKILDEALSEARKLLRVPVITSEKLHENIDTLAEALDITPDIVNLAIKNLGQDKTALTLAFIFERYCEKAIQIPKAYLLGLIKKHKAGFFHLKDSLLRLRKERIAQKKGETFPANGSIYFTKWRNIALEFLPKPAKCPDHIASEFRQWCYERKVDLNRPDIEQIFTTFCSKQFNANGSRSENFSENSQNDERPEWAKRGQKAPLEVVIETLRNIKNKAFQRAMLREYQEKGYNITLDVIN
ncbi:replication initiation protein RepC [Bartonella sp. DGB2]|uniref:replication initiation protein RepC n=1 Tax=Bartonella sp. DGB2 TaxID=3388426 RepID=UPI00398FAB19